MVRSAALAVVSMVAVFRLAGYFNGPLLGDERIHAIEGEPARVATRVTPDRLTVITWNIEQGSRYDDILATLRAQDADVVLLQEVDRFCRRSGNRDIARDLAHALDMNWVSGGEFQEIGEGRGGVAAVTGQALLSRYPIEDAAAIVFARQSSLRWRVNPVQPRRGGRIALHARTAGMDIYNVHLESVGSDALRDAQVKDVIAADAWSGRGATLIGGDFNNTNTAVAPLLAAMRAHGFADALGDASRETSVRHRHPIDWLFVRGLAESSGRVERVAGVSDHYPVIATLALRQEER
jgi:endonuclease/exonuclease/phosphatase family metal-dependent hydrolase